MQEEQLHSGTITIHNKKYKSKPLLCGGALLDSDLAVVDEDLHRFQQFLYGVRPDHCTLLVVARTRVTTNDHLTMRK
jgi:hypothetical protein